MIAVRNYRVSGIEDLTDRNAIGELIKRSYVMLQTDIAHGHEWLLALHIFCQVWFWLYL